MVIRKLRWLQAKHRGSTHREMIPLILLGMATRVAVPAVEVYDSEESAEHSLI